MTNLLLLAKLFSMEQFKNGTGDKNWRERDRAWEDLLAEIKRVEKLLENIKGN